MARAKKEIVASDVQEEEKFYTPQSIAMGSSKKIIAANRRGERMVATEGKDHGFNTLSNIRSLKNPLKSSDSGISAKDAVELCQKAYQNIPIFKNTIEIMTEFANSPIHFRGKDEQSIKFFESWWKKVNSYDIADQFHRELNRSTNVFFYRMMYTFTAQDAIESGMPSLTGKSIPIRYALLDPCSIKCDGGSSFLNANYSKILNNYEISRLKNPTTKKDKELLNSLSPEERKAIASGRGEIAIKLNDEKLVPVFIKKQDYEPLSVPFFYPVLSDINLKLEFKKADLAIAKTTDYLILLMTMGAKKDDGGTNPKLLEAMEDLFKSESVGRVIVADWTTKGEFIIPDLNKILGDEKYSSVNRDIAQGMMNIFFESDQKFSNSLIKVKVFLERLNEARRIFRDKFLIPEMEKIAEEVGIKEVPIPVFEKIDLEDKSQLLRVYTRLAEIGFLTPEEFFEVSESGIIPEFEKSKVSQKEFKKLKNQGLFEPLIGGAKEPVSGRPAGTKSPKAKNSSNKPSTNVSVKESTRKSGAASLDFSDLKDVYDKVSALVPSVESAFKDHFKVQRLSSSKKEQAFSFVESIVVSEPMNKWEKSIKDYVAGKKTMVASDEILELSEEHSVPIFQAAILFHSKKEKV